MARQRQSLGIVGAYGGVLFIVVKFSYDLRDFSSMKAIYVFPGLGCFTAMLMSGLSGMLASSGRCDVLYMYR